MKNVLLYFYLSVNETYCSYYVNVDKFDLHVFIINLLFFEFNILFFFCFNNSCNFIDASLLVFNLTVSKSTQFILSFDLFYLYFSFFLYEYFYPFCIPLIKYLLLVSLNSLITSLLDEIASLITEFAVVLIASSFLIF